MWTGDAAVAGRNGPAYSSRDCAWSPARHGSLASCSAGRNGGRAVGAAGLGRGRSQIRLTEGD